MLAYGFNSTDIAVDTFRYYKIRTIEHRPFEVRWRAGTGKASRRRLKVPRADTVQSQDTAVTETTHPGLRGVEAT